MHQLCESSLRRQGSGRVEACVTLAPQVSALHPRRAGLHSSPAAAKHREQGLGCSGQVLPSLVPLYALKMHTQSLSALWSRRKPSALYLRGACSGTL